MFCNHYYLYICFTASRVVSLGLCSSKDCFIYGSLDRTVLLWDQQAKKCQGLLHVQGRPATAYNDQGRVFAVAFGGYIRLFDARKYEGPFDIFSDGGDVSDANEVKLSNDGRLMLLTTLEGHIHVLHSFQGTLVLVMVVYMLGVQGAGKSIHSLLGKPTMLLILHLSKYLEHQFAVASWMSFHTEPPVIKWAPGSLMFVSDHLSYHFGILICLNWELTLGVSKVSNIQHPYNFLSI
ncbi:protein ANTHESIS POMOTING FACTOR 1-like isoform X2 [Citrus sinensis]|uniref:protein ANTHESIS POMOTING FACTOR 1-like isoform X2 n=1 Tax=Citrus sinensis TaxID=2711 RepID=UPI00227965CC|nr:protein ANTHESIS POMOTING FACTOR 1-like isoform X2 [Citrus sinensis]